MSRELIVRNILPRIMCSGITGAGDWRKWRNGSRRAQSSTRREKRERRSKTRTEQVAGWNGNEELMNVMEDNKSSLLVVQPEKVAFLYCYVRTGFFTFFS
jgi:hypothetical protein